MRLLGCIRTGCNHLLVFFAIHEHVYSGCKNASILFTPRINTKYKIDPPPIRVADESVQPGTYTFRSIHIPNDAIEPKVEPDSCLYTYGLYLEHTDEATYDSISE